MSAVPALSIVIPAFFFATTFTSACTHGTDRPISFEAKLLCGKISAFQSDTLESATFTRETLQDLFALHQKEANCDRGPLAKASSEIVVKALAADTKNVIAAIDAQAELLDFTLRHITGDGDDEDLKKAGQNQEESCKREAYRACSPLANALQKALKEGATDLEPTS